VDLCNALSMAFAIPVAVFDISRIASYLEVRHADGDETYLTFAGETEHPDKGEVVFVDGDNRAHARRWSNRQSGLSATRDDTSSVLIVAEALHTSAGADVSRLTETLVQDLATAWSAKATATILTADAPRAEF
jgi:DNA/RNA-binding domain of Phe-tRNA-synthetase-like protein